MFKGYLFSLLGLMAMITSIVALPATPLGTDLMDREEHVDLDTNDVFDFDDSLDFDDLLDVDDDQSPNHAIAALGPRDKKHFTFFRRRFFTKSCGPNGTNCQEGGNDVMHIHTDCNGGGCGGSKFIPYQGDSRLCDRKFKVCGTEYQLKYTGKEWSCMRLKLFAREGEHHGRTYANLMRGSKKVGTCKVFTKNRYAKSCSVFGASDFWSSVRCYFD